MSNVVHRELTRVIGETGAGGETTREEKIYEYGIEVDGTFVRIGVVTEGQVADARNRAEAERERSGEQSSGGTQPSQSQSAGGSTPPNEATPASQASTSTDAG